MKRIALLLLGLLLFCGCTAKTDFTVPTRTDETRSFHMDEERITVLINKNSRKYHLDFSCIYAARMKEENRLLIEVPDTKYLSEHGYEPCSRCSDLNEHQEK